MSRVILAIALVFSAAAASAAQFGTPEYDVDDGRVRRSRSDAVYTWVHVDAEGDEFQVRVSTTEGREWFDKVQAKYRRTGHEGSGYRRYLQYDPYRSSTKFWAETLQKKARSLGVDDVALALSFVQSIPYQDVKGYQRFPYETLIDWAGDCSDTTVLFAGLVEAMNYGWILLQFKSDKHIAVGVKASESYARSQSRGSATSYTWKGSQYYFAETTGTGWRLGDKPDDLKRYADFIGPISRRPFTAPNDVLVFEVRSLNRYKLWIEFCSDNAVWPGANNLWVLDDSDWHSFRLSCTRGEKICYGAVNSTDPAKVTGFWGAGIDCSERCENCCYTCGKGVARFTLQ